MNRKKNSNILKFPSNIIEAERQVEAILFAAEEPLDLKSIQTRLDVKANVPKILQSLENQYKNRGINLICIANKWSFRTPSNLSKLMNLQNSTQKKTIQGRDRNSSNNCLSSTSHKIRNRINPRSIFCHRNFRNIIRT